MDQKSNHQLFWSSFSCFKYSRNVGLVASIVLCVVYRKVSLRIRITKCSVTHSEVGFIMPQQYAKICFWMQRQSGSILDRPEPLFFCSPRKRKTRAALSLSLSLSLSLDWTSTLWPWTCIICPSTNSLTELTKVERMTWSSGSSGCRQNGPPAFVCKLFF